MASRYKGGVYTGDAELDEAISEFVAYRKEIKKPMTDRAITILLSKLEKVASSNEEKIECIENAILHNWMSVYPTRERRTNEQSRRCDSKDTDEYSEQFAKLFG